MPALGGSGILPPLGLAPAAVAAQSLVAVGVARGVCVPPSGAGSVRLASSLVCGGALWLLSLCCLPGLWWSLVVLLRRFPRPGGARWSVRRCRVALGAGGCGRRRGRFPGRWSSSGSGRPRRRRCSRRPGRAGRVPAGGSPVRGSGLGCLRSGGRPAVSPVVAARCASRSRGVGAGRLVVAGSVAPALPALPLSGGCVDYSASSPTGHSNRGRAAALTGMKFINSGSSSRAAGSASGHSFRRQHPIKHL